jgi:hypothetical protein
MGGGLLQLVAYGAQDAYLSGNPQITFWKGLFKRHTNFAMEPFRINLTGQAAWGVKHSALIGRHADLLYSTYIEVVMPVGTFNNDQGRLGYNLIKYVELDIGGQLIDRLYGEWLYLWDALSSDLTTSKKLWNMVGGGPNTSSLTQSYSDNLFVSATDGGSPDVAALGSKATTVAFSDTSACISGSGNSGHPALPNVLYIPLNFFYTRNPGAALPLIALQYHEVKINIEWNEAQVIAGNFVTGTKTLKQPVQAAVYIDYIYLDTEERRRMAQNSHEYLIEQTQFNEDKGISSYNNRIDLTFNHPVKELVWVVQPTSYTNCSVSKAYSGTRLQPFTYDQDAVYEQHLQINGQDRMDRRYGDYFNSVQSFQHHSGISATVQTATSLPIHQPGIYSYSFALRPEEHQPSGTCNFSRIDTATIVMNMSGGVTISADLDATWDVRVYAVNYNILRVMSGMGGLAYSN